MIMLLIHGTLDMVDQQCARLMELISHLDIEERVAVIFGIARIPIKPVIDMVNYCLEGMSSAQFSLHAMVFLIDRVFKQLKFIW